MQDFVPRGRLSLKTEELSASSGADAADHHEVLWGPNCCAIPISYVLIPRLLLWQLHWLISVHSMATCNQLCCSRCDMETLLPSSKHISVYYHLHDVHLDDLAHVPVQHNQLHCYTHWGLGACHGIIHVWLEYLRQHCIEVRDQYWTGGNVFVFLSLWRWMDALQWGRTFCVMDTDNYQLKIVSGSSSPISVSNLPFQQSAVSLHPTSNMNCHLPCEDSIT
jgi:hypothetical protein